ncbi:MAG TPA: prenyltransferase/squalene oxidase repeat-containing protein [Thermoleophilaceae bacterium]|nr:prenyltransferase/squalene oxidase repeat-containing protein [Thermoleophilaceae bacterium]
MLLVPAAASAAQDKQRLDRTVAYLQKVQHKDGGFGDRVSDPGFSFWAAMAFASAGINPRDQKQKGGTDLYTYLTRHKGPLTESTHFARLILVARAAGASPHRFGGIDPVARLRRLQRPDGGFPQPPTLPTSQVNGTTFAILALAKLERTRVNRAVDWLLTQQAPDGSFGGDTDQTGSAIEALNAAGRRRTPQQAKALQYLRARQNPDGGFAQSSPGDTSNTSSTAWVVRGLVAARIEATSIRAAGSGKTPLDYLAAMQQPDGSIPTSAKNRSNLAFSTAFTTPALSGASFPIAAVQREEQPRTEQRDEPAPKTQGDDGGQPGAGGTADGGDGDVTSGGGGDGAPLFSEPQPGSRGQAPGGARDIERPNQATQPGAVQPAGESVSGKLVGQGAKLAAVESRRLGTAPGLRAAAAGGQAPTWLVATIGVALLLSAMGGVFLERRGGKGRES